MSFVKILDDREGLRQHFTARQFKRRYSREWIDDTKLRRVLPAAILREMDRYHLIGETFEIERYANAIGGGRTKIGIKFHRWTPAYTIAIELGRRPLAIRGASFADRSVSFMRARSSAARSAISTVSSKSRANSSAIGASSL